MRLLRIGVGLVFALLLHGAVAGAASAATASVSSDEIRYTAGSGKTNNLTVTQSGNSVTFAEAGADPITGCGSFGAASVTCTVVGGASVRLIIIDLGDGNDQARNSATPTSETRWNDGTGNDTATGSSGARDRFLWAEGDDAYSGGHAGDNVDYRAAPSRVLVTLDGNRNDGPSGEEDNVSVPTVTGSNFNDTLTGNNGANQLTGWFGNDTLVGRGGNDVLYGDEACLGVPPSGGNDTLWGQDGDDELRGCGGDDQLLGGAGADMKHGGQGRDRASYDTHTAPLSASIGDGANDGNATDGPAGARDDIKPDVEDIRGGLGSDTLKGSAGPNQLVGSSGDDDLDGGAGADDLIGNSGADTFSGYRTLATGVSITLDGVANDGPDGDNVRPDIETVHGGEGDDTITGTDTAQRLVGRGGHDTIDGRGGPDDLEGGDGNDTLLAADGTVDSSIDCGLGTGDSADVDLDDPPTTGCETEDRPAPPPAGDTGGTGGSVDTNPPAAGTAGPDGGIVDPGAPGAAQNEPPEVNAFGISRRRFAVSRKPTPVAAGKRRAPLGAVFRYSLSEDSRVSIRIDKRLSGVLLRAKAGALRCVRSTSRTRVRLTRELLRLRSVRKLSGAKRKRALARLTKKRRCVALKRTGTLTRAGSAGPNQVPFSGRIGKRALSRGDYQATIRATDSDNAVSDPHAVRFKIVRR